MRNRQNIILAVITPREQLQQFAVNKRQFAITQENRSCNEGALAKSRPRYICKRNSERNIVTWYTTRHFVLKKRDFQLHRANSYVITDTCKLIGPVNDPVCFRDINDNRAIQIKRSYYFIITFYFALVRLLKDFF